MGAQRAVDGHAPVSLHRSGSGERHAGVPGFTPPTNLYVDNAGKLVYRIRPRYNSEYVWNVPA
jgi:hypothetical protein